MTPKSVADRTKAWVPVRHIKFKYIWESTIYDHFCPYCRGKRERERNCWDIFCVKHFSTQLLHRATQLLGLLCWMADKKFKGIRFKVNVDIYCRKSKCEMTKPHRIPNCTHGQLGCTLFFSKLEIYIRTSWNLHNWLCVIFLGKQTVLTHHQQKSKVWSYFFCFGFVYINSAASR